jgi:phosphoglycolate phosphatase
MNESPELILFDIDATLLKTNRLGIRAMEIAGRELFDRELDAGLVDYAGRLDPLILIDILKTNNIDPSDSTLADFRAGYFHHLKELFSIHPDSAYPLPGVQDLLTSLRTHTDAILGVLTGNFPETGTLKITNAGIDMDNFTICVWADDSPHIPPAREHLPAVGIDKHEAHTGSRPEPHRVLIIGDTIHDVSCAHAHNCKCLAVATGVHDESTLTQAGADHVVPDLADTDAILTWMGFETTSAT